MQHAGKGKAQALLQQSLQPPGTARQRAESHRKPKPPCPQCGKSILTRGAVHCGRTCANVTRRQEAEARRGKPTPCLRCGSTERRPRSAGPYCSWECFNNDRYERTGSFARWFAAWQAGEISGTRDDGRPDWRVRQGLVLLRGQCCEKCGWAEVNPVSGRVPLHVDHIDGYRTKNRPEDLRLLCPNCHALTPNYQHLNNPPTGASEEDPPVSGGLARHAYSQISLSR
ncbi:HNH endonuclease signature motif containing protein [Streptomyces sp. NPDC048254]|uniref:HNH endonuclease signature motif containing protein n=1 Tax=Streptomyces sp. NPDC048254 TaxID=3365525 RepID=UPI00371CDD08